MVDWRSENLISTLLLDWSFCWITLKLHTHTHTLTAHTSKEAWTYISSQVETLKLTKWIRQYTHKWTHTFTMTFRSLSFSLLPFHILALFTFSSIPHLSYLSSSSSSGQRVPTMVSGKSLPSFRAYDCSARSGGFVQDRFLTGVWWELIAVIIICYHISVCSTASRLGILFTLHYY